MIPNDEAVPSPASDEGAAPMLSDDAVVVRGGLCAPETLRDNAVEHHDHPDNMSGDFAISIACLQGRTADEIAERAEIPHPKIRQTTVGRIRAAGYDVVPDEPPPAHALITLPVLPTDEDYMTISQLFDPPRTNPRRKEGAANE